MTSTFTPLNQTTNSKTNEWLETSQNIQCTKMKRDLYWDTLKFSLMFLVIYGHVISGCSYGGRFNLAMYNFIYLFHMPLFIFISGRFSQIKNRETYKKNIFRLLETFIVFQIISSAILMIHNHEFSYKFFYEPNWILWYLVSLIFWRLIIFFIPMNWLSYRNRTIIISLSISLLAGFIPVSYPFALQKTLTYLPFFIVGYFSNNIDVKSKISKIPPYIAIGILIITFSILYFVINKNLSTVTHCCSPYWSSDVAHTLFLLIARCIFLITAFILSIMVMRITYTSKILSKWGGITLFLYIYHAFALREFLFPLIKTYNFSINEFSLMIYSIAITIILIMLSHFKFLSQLLNPISSWQQKSKIVK